MGKFVVERWNLAAASESALTVDGAEEYIDDDTRHMAIVEAETAEEALRLLGLDGIAGATATPWDEFPHCSD